MSDMMQVLKELFNSDLLSVHNPSHNFFRICPIDKFNNNKFEYITFEVDDYEGLFIYYISNECGFSGKEVMQKLEIFARQFNKKFIRLYDYSKIKIQNVPLPLLFVSLIKYDSSFYGRMGFTSEEYELMIKRWLKIKTVPLSTILWLQEDDISFISEICNYKNTNIYDFCNLVMNKLQNGLIKNDTVVQILVRIIRNECLVYNELQMYKQLT